MSKKKARVSRKLALTLLLAGTAGATAWIPSAVYAATTGTIKGIVRDSAGKPVAGAQVFLLPSGQTATTDAGGNYIFTGVDPTTYTVRVEQSQYQTSTAQVTVSQDNTSPLDFTLESRVIQTGGPTRIIGTPVRRTSPTTQYNISAKIEQETKSQPNNLYQFPGLVFGQPGITPDAGGYVHIRGSDINQVGFDVDGIQITEPMTNTFATNLVTVGLKSANLYTGGADASYGNATGGFINEVTNNGRDLRGGVTEFTYGPGHGWNYNGTNTQYGNVTPNGKFDYYTSTIAFRNGFPSGINGLQKLNASFDGVLKANYYADPNNTFSAFYSQGFEQYDEFDPGSTAANHPFKFDEHLGTSVDTKQYQQDHDDQGYNFAYLSYKHNFTPKSFLTYRLYRIRSEVTFHLENLAAEYENRHSDQVGNQLDYSNQLATNDSLRAGFAIIPSTTKYRLLQDLSGSATMLPLSDPNEPGFGYRDQISRVKPDQYNGYLSNEFRTTGDKVTFTTGVRLAAMDYKTVDHGSYTKTYIDPRLGLNYSPDRTTVFRTSFAENSQFADSSLVERLFPEDNGSGIGTFTSLNPGNASDFNGLDPNRLPGSGTASRATQYGRLLSRYAPFNKLGPQHAHNFDLGVEKSFDVGAPVVGGSYAMSVTGYRHQQYDLIQLNRVFYVSPDSEAGGQIAGTAFGQRSYNTDGKGHASGVEVQFSRRPRNANDLSGFISYTNQVAKATNSDYDTGYNPYFYNTFINLGPTLGLNDKQFRALNNTAYPTSYDQRHTVAVVVNKRITKLFEESAVLDAGSGFPFTAAVGGGSDPQHANQTSGNANFFDVPILLADQKTLQPLNPLVGRSGWHYKISLNTSLNLTPDTSLFMNVDNVFDRKTVVSYSTVNPAGVPYYISPSAEFPQGRVYYGPNTILTPVFFTIGFRHKF